MKLALASVISNEEIAGGVFVIRLEEPDQAKAIQPGQFVHVRCGSADDPLLRRPLSVLRTGASPANRLPLGQYEVLYDVVGRGTDLLSRARAGDLLDVLGPLGQPFKIERNTRRLLLVGGGVGIVPLVALAEVAIRRDVSVTLACGFRDASKVFPSDRLPAEVEYLIATEDGSVGYSGFVTGLAGEHVGWADQICACGPVAMLRALAKLERPRTLPIQIAMEERMGCAMGVCLGCVVPTRHGPKRVCRDGPVFRLEEMGWT
ncbi:MAG: dihydroorotate dehydrogenase electron transfer subunit [Chloroflexota bacterium]